MVPVDALAFIVTHSGEEHTPGLCLLHDVLDNLRAPVIILSVVQRISPDGQSVGGTEKDAPMAADAVLLVAPNLIVLSVIVVNVEGTLISAYLTLDTSLLVSFYEKLGW